MQTKKNHVMAAYEKRNLPPLCCFRSPLTMGRWIYAFKSESAEKEEEATLMAREKGQ